MAKDLANKHFWEKHWKGKFLFNDKAIWEVSFNKSIESDFKLFQPFFQTENTVIDIGCGSGYYTQFLKEKYDLAIGVDASYYAIEKAKKDHPSIFFKQVNLLNEEEVLALKQEVKDSNIYVRGVLHQIHESDRHAFCNALKTLMGDEGCLFINESIPNQRYQLKQNSSKLFDVPLKNNLFLPSGVGQEEITQYFPESLYEVLKSDKSKLETSLEIAKDKKLILESLSFILRKKQFN